tara:strand:- start:1867 stop:2157 length:291 start_codon:yes stop_codon:yes gene_type:complete
MAKEVALNDIYYLSEEQINRISPYFSKSHGVPRVDDRRVLCGMIHVLNEGCNGEMVRKNTVPTKPFITGSSVELKMGVSIEYSKSYYRTVCPNNYK